MFSVLNLMTDTNICCFTPLAEMPKTSIECFVPKNEPC